MEHWAKNILGKICPKTSSKHVWTLLVTIFGFFGTLKIFGIFLKIFENSTLHGTLGKSFSKKMPQNTFRTRLDTFGNDFGHFWNFKLFLIFLKFFEDSTFHGKLGKNFSKNLQQNLFKTLLDSFGNGFVRFWLEFWKFFWVFLKSFEDSTLHGKLGKKIFKKFAPKHVQNTFGYFWEPFWVILEFWNFFDIFENFRRLDPPWITGHKIFQKIRPKTRSKHVWILLGTILCVFGWNFENFLSFFEKFRRLDTPWKTGQKFFEKIAPKHVQNTFGYFWVRFWANSENWEFFGFFQDLEVSSLHGTLGKKYFGKNLPQNKFKTRLDTFGNDFRLFWNFENFWYFFENFRKLDPPWNTGQKFFEKNAPKHVQNSFGYFWERFWAFLEF